MLKKVLVIFVCMLLFCANAGADDIKQRYAVITHDKEIAKALYILEQTTGEKYIKVLRGRNSSKQPIKIQFRNFNTLSYDHHNLYAFVKKEDEFWYIYINAELIDEPPAALAPLIAGKTIHGDTNFQLDRKIASAKIEAEVWTKVLQKYPDSANGISELVNYEDELKAAYEKGTLQDYAEWHIKVIQN
ncbi:MAG: hypothetical protein LBJ74_04140, partial [Heliobacteriaceae bacterium]|nr:hypothetical protein [Heliobacteriaceae bacterium]